MAVSLDDGHPARQRQVIDQSGYLAKPAADFALQLPPDDRPSGLEPMPGIGSSDRLLSHAYQARPQWIAAIPPDTSFHPTSLNPTDSNRSPSSFGPGNSFTDSGRYVYAQG